MNENYLNHECNILILADFFNVMTEGGCEVFKLIYHACMMICTRQLFYSLFCFIPLYLQFCSIPISPFSLFYIQTIGSFDLQRHSIHLTIIHCFFHSSRILNLHCPDLRIKTLTCFMTPGHSLLRSLPANCIGFVCSCFRHYVNVSII